MLKRNKEGLYYVSETTGKIYYLHKGTSLDGDKEYTDDIIYIMDSGFTEEEYARWIDLNDDAEDLDCKETFVNWFCGATLLTKEEHRDEYTKYIKEYVDRYESKKKYEFTKQGVKEFYDDSIDNALKALVETNRAIDIDVKIGSMEITIPDTADNYDRLGSFLKECQEDTVPIEDTDKERKGNDMEIKKNDYVVKKLICNSCYSEVFLNVMNIMSTEVVDGWNAMEFLTWLKKKAEDFNNYINDNNCDDDVHKEIFFAVFSEYTDYIQDIVYGTDLQSCLRTEKHVKYYRICLTWDAKLEEIVPRTQTMEERILNTLEAYHMTNYEVLEEFEIQDLKDQIEYMKNKIKEDK